MGDEFVPCRSAVILHDAPNLGSATIRASSLLIPHDGHAVQVPKFKGVNIKMIPRIHCFVP